MWKRREKWASMWKIENRESLPTEVRPLLSLARYNEKRFSSIIRELTRMGRRAEGEVTQLTEPCGVGGCLQFPTSKITGCPDSRGENFGSRNGRRTCVPVYTCVSVCMCAKRTNLAKPSDEVVAFWSRFSPSAGYSRFILADARVRTLSSALCLLPREQGRVEVHVRTHIRDRNRKDDMSRRHGNY